MFLWVFLPVLVFYYVFQKYCRLLWKRGTGELPLGPFPLPILGNVFNLDSHQPYVSAGKFAQDYGKIFSIMLGNQLVIFIADLPLVRKAFKDDRFSGRPRTIWHILNLSGGLALAEGEVYKEHRKFSMQALKDYGFGNTTGEAFIQKEAAVLLRTLQKSEGQPIDNQIPFAATAANVVSYMLFGDRFNGEDSRFLQYLKFEAENFRDSAAASAVEIFPWLRFFPPWRKNVQRMMKRVVTQLDMLKQLVDDHKKTFDSENARDYIDAFLLMQKNGQPSFTDEQLLLNVFDIYAASMETTTTFLRWAMLFMILHPEVQKKARDEIDRVVGRSRPPTFGDRADLPFVEATIYEIFRMANFGPFLLPHKTTTQVEFEGYVLPKDTTVIGLSWYINRDPLLWKDRDEFQPERFLTSDGKFDSATAAQVIPFSVGKRICPGEQLARMEALIFFGTILQNFIISGEENKTPSILPLNGLSKSNDLITQARAHKTAPFCTSFCTLS